MIIVDTETTGLDRWKCGLLSIGAVCFADPSKQFYGECRVRDDAIIDPEGMKVNGFTHEQIKDSEKQNELELVQSFFSWLSQFEDQTIAGTNPSFDRDFINFVAERNNLNERIHYNTIDLHAVAYANFLKAGRSIPLKDHRSDIGNMGLYPLIGLPVEPQPHNALTGAKMEAEAFSRIIYGKGLFEEYKRYPIISFT
ncbi:3'-5' exonuclease [Candidatus Dojkabacteria bacterium]|uniref:3'-5' exonuclease n=1 Tax=Candidatus Dojkabacteria bacterium TaxID=2099670 RepID=A0A955L2X3_9BACT|nr:3'-5' exonuclease [Candidatus Dojkabacteria bacterium]